MFRGLGSCMILVGSLGLGFWYKNQFTGRIKALRLLRTILTLLESEIRYGRGTLPECCGHVAARIPGECGAALLQVAGKMRENGGESFGQIFQSCVEPSLKQMPLMQEDREEFFRFAGICGIADSGLQLRLMEQSREQLEARAEELAGENAGKCRMALGLGAMGGLLILLVLW